MPPKGTKYDYASRKYIFKEKPKPKSEPKSAREVPVSAPVAAPTPTSVSAPVKVTNTTVVKSTPKAKLVRYDFAQFRLSALSASVSQPFDPQLDAASMARWDSYTKAGWEPYNFVIHPRDNSIVVMFRHA